MIQTKSLVEQITPLVQRPVEEEEVFQRSPMDLEPPLPSVAPVQPDRILLRRLRQNAPNHMVLLIRWHHQGRGCPHIAHNISWGAAIENANGDILPALLEAMTMRERRPFFHSISDPRSREIMAGYPSFYDITPHSR